MSSTPQSVRSALFKRRDKSSQKDEAVQEEPTAAITEDKKPSETQIEPAQTVRQPSFDLPVEGNPGSRLETHERPRAQTPADREKATGEAAASVDRLREGETIEELGAANNRFAPKAMTKDEALAIRYERALSIQQERVLAILQEQGEELDRIHMAKIIKGTLKNEDGK